MQQSRLVSAEWLKDHLHDPQVVIVDCRFILGKPEMGGLAYKEGHIPGAFYLDLEKDLSGPVEQHGGRHPLPDLKVLADKLGKIGVSSETKVIAYDDQGGPMAARLWWLLKYLGHSQAAILNESFSTWEKKGYPVTSVIPKATPKQFIANVQAHLLVSMDEVKHKMNDSGVILVDSRAYDRYIGVNETIDTIGGHIPGASCEFWQESLNENGIWKETKEQQERLQKYVELKDKEIIIYCGSGVTACANMIAFEEAGLKPKLYLGSWSDWISYPDNEIAK